MSSLSQDRRLGSRLWSALIVIGIGLYYILLSWLYSIEGENIQTVGRTREYPNASIEPTSGLLQDTINTAFTHQLTSTNLTHSETHRISNASQSTVSHYIYEPTVHCSDGKTYLIYVYSGRNRTDRRQLIRNTWGRLDQYRDLSINLQLFFVLGSSGDEPTKSKNSTNQDIILEKEAVHYGDILMCDAIDSYKNLTLKGLAALKWINSSCDRTTLEFIFKTDDDVYVSLWNVLDLAAKAIQTGSHFLCVNNPNGAVIRRGKWGVSKDQLAEERYPEYCLGGGYGMTLRGFGLLMNSVDKVPIFPIEDAFFTSLAIRWAYPQTNLRYYNISYARARMLYSESKIDKLIMNRSGSLQTFILGHPIPTNKWLKLHDALESDRRVPDV